jgi:hypothetical protein
MPFCGIVKAERHSTAIRVTWMSSWLLSSPGDRTILSTAADDTVREWRVGLGYEALPAWVAVSRYVPELTCQRRAQYRIEPLCEEGSAP